MVVLVARGVVRSASPGVSKSLNGPVRRRRRPRSSPSRSSRPTSPSPSSSAAASKAPRTRTSSARSRARRRSSRSSPRGPGSRRASSSASSTRSALQGPAHQPGDRHPGGRGRLPERQAHPRGRRDRRHRVRGGDLQAGLRDRPGRDRPGRVRPEARRGPDRLVRADVREGLRLEGPEHRRQARPAAGELRPRAGPDQEEGARGVHQGQDDQGAPERGREGPVRRAGQAGDLGAGEGQGSQARKQIENCKLFAPGDGLVVYANDPNRFGGSSQPQIEEGATVRERQKIFSLPDISKMRVNTKVHESMVDRITPGLRARIRVDAFADEVAAPARSRTSPPCPTRPASSARTSRSTPRTSRSRRACPGSGRA